MVKWVFVDTSYSLALNVNRDRFHRQAMALQATLRRPLLTTEWVLTEVADALAAPTTRARFATLIEQLRARRTKGFTPSRSPLLAALSREALKFLAVLLHKHPASVSELVELTGRAQPNIFRSLQLLARYRLLRIA